MSVAMEVNDAKAMEMAPPEPPTIKLDITNNWTGRETLPFVLVAERVLEIEAESQKGALTVSFGKPVLLEGMGWACPFRMEAMGRVHVSPARGVDAVDALQAAFGMVHKQLTGMGRMHRITFGGGDDLGFGSSDAAVKTGAAGCPVMNGSL